MKKCLLLLSALLVSLFIPQSSPAGEYPHYHLKVTLFPKEGKIRGEALIKIPAGIKAPIDYGRLTVEELRINGKSTRPGSGEIDAGKNGKLVEIRFTGEFKNPYTGSEGMVLLDGWYPLLKGDSLYDLTVNLPAEYEAVSECHTKKVRVGEEGKTIVFGFKNPVPKITLVAGKYRVSEEIYRGIAVRTYLFRDDLRLAASYIEHTKKYLDIYIKMLGSYPFNSFNIVENSFQTGYSFPTYTLLGSRVLRLPFIVKTSLGHEILHQWFGCSVYTDYERGNWAEGLTTYLADHWYKEMTGRGRDYRKRILIDYENYTDKESEKSLRSFQSGTTPALRALGYGKSAMVFHMLRKKLGDEKFFLGLKDFIAKNSLKKAGWEDLEKSCGKYLKNKSFFRQWIETKGVIDIALEDLSVLYRKGRYRLGFRLRQKGGVYSFNLPVRLETEKGTEEFVFPVDRKIVDCGKSFKGRPLKIHIDPEYDLMRSLGDSEKPPVISSLMGDGRKLLVIPDDENERKKYDYAVEFFRSRGFRYLNEGKVTDSDLKRYSLVFLSAKNRIYRRLFADRKLPDAGLVIRVDKNPYDTDRSVMLVHAKNESELVMGLRKAGHYGGFSLLLFNKGRNIKKSVSGSQMGLVKVLDPDIRAIETERTLGIDDIVERIKNKPVIYVGEVHTNYSHHLVQFEIIRKLHKIRGKILIGMEMFQQPFQEYLDRYLNREIGENEFLRKSEYFTRWRYDYNLYREILHFARENGIRVVALNLRGEIVKKVFRKGIDSLTPGERKEIPPDMDLTNNDYRKSMLHVMGNHSMGRRMNFINFYQAQILWDETMAHNAVKAMKEDPGVPLVVLAGNGHLQYSWGIPGRVKRLSGADQSVILLGAHSDIGRSVADFIVFPEEVDGPVAPQLGVYLTETRDGLLISKLVKDRPAMKGGIKTNDIIVSIDGKAVKNIPDLKIILLNRRTGDRINVMIKRRKLAYFFEEIVIKLEL